ncbi:MAG: 30S ribosomal protein S20 [Gammaproteobacteria bacterium RIFCSPHIGHO2_12_FULL_42_10]|nr:MAG: 30S ribosomal protein S20 [Gammaproteobacteria bacterium RIFCSPHIGHO2_12_FULL_42_10]
MANTKQAKKRVRQAEKHNENNTGMRTKLRTYIKKATAALETKDKKQALSAIAEAVPVIDRMATKRIISKNKAARQKSRLMKRAAGLE